MLEIDGVYRGYFKVLESEAIFRVVSRVEGSCWYSVDYFTTRNGLYTNATIQGDAKYQRVPFHEWALCIMKEKLDKEEKEVYT
jgi:hypothetical protein